MNPIRDEDRVRRVITEQAAAWYVRQRESELSRPEKDAFLAWLRSSRIHVAEYLAIAEGRRGLREALASLDLTEEQILARAQGKLDTNVVPLVPIAAPSPTPSRTRPWNRNRWLALVAALLSTVLAIYLSYLFMDSSTIEVPHGEQRTVQLPDGSIMHVNASSRLHVRFSKQERRIELDHGQVLIEVAHDRNRPLRVRAGTADVTAVGTQFEVYRRQSGVTVTVVQGKVDVRRETAPEKPLHLAAGEQVDVSDLDRPPQAHEVDVRAATAWVRREIVFDHRPLEEVVEEFNRYIPVPVRIEDEALKERQVSGVWAAYDTESLILYLRRRQGAEVEEGEREIVVRARAALSRPSSAIADRPVPPTEGPPEK
jgi:transmembrane sensor